MRVGDLTIHDGLSIVTLDGFEGEPDYEGQVDVIGSANWLVEGYGMADQDLAGPGILWTDYDSPADEPWRFSVLIDSGEVEAFTRKAEDAGYEIIRTEPIDEPQNFGDGGGTVEIVKHRDGWLVLQN